MAFGKEDQERLMMKLFLKLFPLFSKYFRTIKDCEQCRRNLSFQSVTNDILPGENCLNHQRNLDDSMEKQLENMEEEDEKTNSNIKVI